MPEKRGVSVFYPTLKLLTELVKHKEFLTSLKSEITLDLPFISSSKKDKVAHLLNVKSTPLVLEVVKAVGTVCENSMTINSTDTPIKVPLPPLDQDKELSTEYFNR